MITNGIDIVTQIINYIAVKGIVRTGQLVEYFARKTLKTDGNKETILKTNEKIDNVKSENLQEKPKDNTSKITDFEMNEESKKSKRTIHRTLKKMKKEGLIVSLNPEQAKMYGKEDPDGRAKFLTLAKTIELVSYFDDMLEIFKKGDIVDKKMVLREIKRYEKKYVLYPNQLDILVLNLDIEDDELIDSLLELFYNYIINKEIKPKNETVFLEKLRNLLERCEEGHFIYSMLRRRVIRLLGTYDDDYVVEHLIKDAKSGKLSKFKDNYGDKFTAKPIERRKKDLFLIENKMEKEGNTETAKLIREIRDNAASNADKPIEPDKPIEDVVGSPVSKSKTKRNFGIKP